MSEDQMSHVPVPESTPEASQPESGPVGDRDAQDAREAISERCGFTVIEDGDEEPCDRPAPSWRWYQGHFHEDTLDHACELHENEGGRRMATLVARVAELEAWEGRSVARSTWAKQKVRAERAEAALARVEALADEARAKGYYVVQINVADLRAALAAAGPAVSDAPRQADATLRAKLLDLHVECRMGMCGEPSGFCHQCDNDWPCDTVEYVRLFSAAPAVSDGEGATSETATLASLTRQYEALAAEVERRQNAPTCPTCGSDGEPREAKDGSTCPNPFHLRPTSPVVAPSATDEGGAFPEMTPAQAAEGLRLNREMVERRRADRLPTPDAVPSGEATDGTTPTKEA